MDYSVSWGPEYIRVAISTLLYLLYHPMLIQLLFCWYHRRWLWQDENPFFTWRAHCLGNGSLGRRDSNEQSHKPIQDATKRQTCESISGLYEQECCCSTWMVGVCSISTVEPFCLVLTKLPRGAMSKKERLAYVDAVLCLQSKPSKIPLSLVPGARNRFDNFQAVHINQTFLIHFNVRNSNHCPCELPLIKPN